MAASKRVRWECPNGRHPGVLGPSQPRRNSIVRYCLPCSEADGVLVERTAPAVERKRAAGAERSKAKAAAKRSAAAVAKRRAVERETARFTIEGVDLRDEMRRYRKLPIFRGSRVARTEPDFTVTRHRGSTSRRGFAEPWAWRIHLAISPYMDLETARKIIVHELCHLYVGKVGKEWHGVRFQLTLKRALAEAELRQETTGQAAEAG